MPSFTYEQIVEAINALPPQDQLKIREWLNQSAVAKELEQRGALNDDVTNASDVNAIPPITMRRVAPIAAERGIEKEMKWGSGGRSIYFRDPVGNLVEIVTKGQWPVQD